MRDEDYQDFETYVDKEQELWHDYDELISSIERDLYSQDLEGDDDDID